MDHSIPLTFRIVEGASDSATVDATPVKKAPPTGPLTAKISSPLRNQYTWSTMEVNAHERALVFNERTRFELEMTPLICRLSLLEQEFSSLKRENLYIEAWNRALVTKFREYDWTMPIPVPKYDPAHFQSP